MAYGYYRTLTIDHTKCGSSSSSSFPVLVSISAATSVKTVANGGKINNTGTQTGGAGGTMPFDLVFSSDTAGASKYPWEVEKYDGTTGDLIAWVQVPSVSNSVDTVFYMVYGDAAVNTQQNTSTLAPSAVWDANYKGVWHLADVTAGGTTKDSTSNAINGTASATSPTSAAAQIGNGASFDGNTARNIDIGSSSSLGGLTAFTLEGWIKPSGFGDDGGSVIIACPKSRGPGAVDPFQDTQLSVSATSVVTLASTGVAGSRKVDSQTTTISTGTWYHIVGTYDGSTLRSYRNGVLLGSGTAAASITTPSTPSTSYRIGQVGIANSDFAQVNGLLDEVRFSNSRRSADWILTQYNNQNAPGNIGSAGFLTFGAETSAVTGKLFLDSTLSGLTTGGPFFRNPIG